MTLDDLISRLQELSSAGFGTLPTYTKCCCYGDTEVTDPYQGQVYIDFASHTTQAVIIQ